MSKYVSPIIEIEKVHSVDVITSSNAVTISELKGVDNGESKTAIFDAGFWFE